jgi:hypothetical protein
VRFSSQIYLEQADFVRFGNAVVDILQEDPDGDEGTVESSEQ